VATVYTTLLDFFSQMESDQNHRFKSWDHCYFCFLDKNIDKRIACLHLSFYLASWGMYRGSSFLLWKDYLIHLEVVEKILSCRDLQKIDYEEITGKKIEKIFKLVAWIKNWYKENIKEVNGILKDVNATDTLVTKILLGSLGCVPAYDRFFVDGLRSEGISPLTFTPRSYLSVIDFYNKNKTDFDIVQEKISAKAGVCYPVMKMVDMYFWQVGLMIAT